MKLLNCHIENFGKLSNFDYKFKDGLNTIEEDNGFGKTTFANFIKAMFYGLDTKRVTKTLTDRKQYEPWQGGAFGRNIQFEINDKKYRLERFFGKKESEDTFKLYNLSTNLESKDYSSKIGEEIFKINKEAYERSTFISGQNMETTMNDSINAKLGNILESENDVNTSEQALKLLDEAIKKYKKTGGRGEINEKTFEKLRLEKKLEQKKTEEQELKENIEHNNELLNLIKDKDEELEETKKIYKSILEAETKKAKKENYKIFKDNLKESKAKVKEYEEFFKNGILEQNEIETLIEKCLLIEKSNAEIKTLDILPESINELNNLKKQYNNEDISEEIINEKIDKYKILSENKNKINLNNEKLSNLKKEGSALNKQIKRGQIISLFLCLISIILTMVIIISIIRNVTQFIKIDIVVAVICFTAFILKSISMSKKKKKCKNIEEELKQITKIQSELKEDEEYDQKDIDTFIDQFSDEDLGLDKVRHLVEIKAKYTKYEDLKRNIENSLEKQREMIKKTEELEKNIRNTLLQYFPELTKPYINYAQEIQIKNSEYLKQKEDYETKLKAKEDYEKTNDIQIIETINETDEANKSEENGINLDDINKNEIEKKLKELEEELNKLNEEKNNSRNQIETLEDDLAELNEAENDLENVNTELNKMKEDCELLEKTKQYLETAKITFSSHYLGGMQKSFIKNLKLINGSDIDANLDVNLNVQINELGGNKELKYFSTGYKDLIYICMRLSLIDSLFESEKPFVILDDPFVNLDKTKIKNAINMLKNVSKKYQLIYFICHESRG